MKNLSKPTPEVKLPHLEYYAEGGGARLRVAIHRFPFLIGRSKNAHHIIPTAEVSKQHAEIVCVDRQIRVRDLGSTNGTFVNGQRITEGPLTHGDILHFAHHEFRFVHPPVESQSATDLYKTAPTKSGLPASIIRGGERLRELLEQQSVVVAFQPIVDLKSREIMGFEALGRSAHLELSAHPTELFHLADQCKLAPDLSRMLRRVSVEEARRLPDKARLFLNLHSAETLDQPLVDSLRELREAMRADQNIVLEVNEEMVTDVRSMRWLRETLQPLGIELAYDDFGAGQARLAELAEAPPHFVKLDMGLVRGIDQATARREFLLALSRAITDLGIELIAEGIETTAEAKVCLGLGCRFGQGFLFGRPQAAPLACAKFDLGHRIIAPASDEDTLRPEDIDSKLLR